MNKLTGTILTLPKMSGNVGAKTINIGGKGDDGATFTPSVSADGIISWTNDKDLPNPEPVNIKGTKGDKGDKGDRGLQGVQGIQGERGEQGQKGDKGDRGEQGIQGIQGAKGETGAQGQKGADGTPATHRWSGTTLHITSASGTSSANLKGDKGDKGETGPQGPKGDTGDTGPQGPKGDTGNTGPQGPAGPEGAQGKPGANGTDGKSAYAYAKDAGYTGTETEFAEKLASESSGIHIGTDAPTDENINVWIDTDEEPEEVPGTGSGIDVTAEVGQTIIVEEVDGNGKPTKWKAVEYQPRTHYSTYEEVQLLDNVTFLASDDAMLDFFLVEGQSYRVIHNGTTYEEVAVGFNLDGIGFTLIGNPAAGVGDDNGKPYAILNIDGMTTQYVSMTGTDDTITLYTNQETVHEIPQKYLPDMRPYYVVISPDLDGDGTEMVTMETVESFTAALTTGRAIIAKVYTNGGGVQFVPLFSAQDSKNILLFNTYGASVMLSANDEGGYNVTIKFG